MNALRAALLNPLATSFFGVAAAVLLLATILLLTILPATTSNNLMHFPLLLLGLFVTTPASAIAAIGAIPALRRRFWLFLLVAPVAYFVGLWLFLVVTVNTGLFRI